MNGLIYFNNYYFVNKCIQLCLLSFITVNIVLDMTIAISYCPLVETELIYVLIMLFINFDIIVKNKVSH